MSEEKAEEKKEEVQEAKQANKKREKAPAKPKVEKHIRKVTRMSIAELESAMEETRNKMGGLHSRYGRALQERHVALLKRNKETPVQKAA